ncbi:MAG TPA: ABC transporter permease [Vicinamibacterales bacterium]
MRTFFARLRARLRNRSFDADLAEELRVHEEMKRAELIAAGVEPDDARAAARRALGNVTLMREEARRVWIAPWVESVIQDARYAVRTLLRQPLHTATSGLVLVLGIGLTAALFTLFNAMVLKPWPVRDPDAVVRVIARTGTQWVGPSVDEYRYAREHVTSFSGLVAFSPNYPVRLRADGISEVPLRGTWVSANFFDVLGARLHLGSGFINEDDVDGNRRSPVVLGHTAWRNHFGGAPSVVGRPVFLAGKPFTVIGVLDPEFDGNGKEVDLWMPLSAFSTVRPSTDVAWERSVASGNCCIGVAGRLADGSSEGQARQELQLLHEQFTRAAGKPSGTVELFGTAEIAGPNAARYAVLGAFAGAVGLILVLACANVGNLQLARAVARRREIATRLSIGASRARIVRQLLTEGLVLALVAGAAAVAIAVAIPRVLFAAAGEEIPPYTLARLTADADVVFFILAMSLVACLAFALTPALHVTRVRIPLGVMGRTSTTATRFHLRGGLLAIQIAACTVLLVGAGLVTRAIAHAMAFDVGFQMQGVDMITFTMPSGASWKDRQSVTMAVLDAVTVPGEAAVALAEVAPVSGTPLVMHFALPAKPATEYETALLRPVSPQLFEVLGIPIVAGDVFGPADTDRAVVNESFVRAFSAEDSQIGKTLRDVDGKGGVRRTFTIVGVVRDSYMTGLEGIEPVIYTPTRAGLLLTRGGPETFERIRAAALAINPGLTITRQPLTDSLRKYLEQSRFGAYLAWALGLFGLGLAMVGVFGVFAYAVEERRREIGVRLALGATRTHIVRMLVSTHGRAMLAGLGAGVLLSFVAGPVLRSYLFGLSPLDPLAYLLVLGLLSAAAVLATAIPTRRAMRLDPAVTLREE